MRDLYFAAQGLAYIKGVDNFVVTMPFERFRKLHLASLQTYGFKWTERNFIGFAVKAAH